MASKLGRKRGQSTKPGTGVYVEKEFVWIYLSRRHVDD